MYAGQPYAGGAYAGAGMLLADVPVNVEPELFSVEVAFTTDALATPAWVDISGDVRFWDVSRGRGGELERFQPGRATVVLDNADRDYDSQHATGPWFGNLRPMRRLRIRETFSGVTYPTFDGYIDGWDLDYPEHGVDAVAVVTATDGFKVFNRTDLPRSVYFDTVEADSPVLWFALDETKIAAKDAVLSVLNMGTRGSTGDGTYVGLPELGTEALVVNDPGTSMTVTSSTETPGTTDMGVRVAAAGDDLSYGSTWAFEAWCIPATSAVANLTLLWNGDNPSPSNALVNYQTSGANLFQFSVENDGSAIFFVNSAGSLLPHLRYHLVGRFTLGSPLELWVNGVRTTGTIPTGTYTPSLLHIGFAAASPSANWIGPIQHVAFYDGAASTAINQAWVDRHYAAGTAPWQGDLPGVRAGRVLDEANWPAGLRELDNGETAFQSAAPDGQPVLEHLQKTAETEAGALFMNKAGAVRLIARDARAARVSQATFGDGAGEIGYRSVTFDDGDNTIRNRATISRLNGVARTSEDVPSVAEFGRFQYALDGLLHDTEAHSTAYAAFVVAEYAQPRRRVTSLQLGPAATGQEATLYPALLGVELGDVVTVKCRPPGGGAVFTQACVVEGIQAAWSPAAFRTGQLVLSPVAGTF